MRAYIDQILGFYFDSGFDQMVIDADLDETEINEWGSLAVLFDHCFRKTKLTTDQEKEEAYMLVEALFVKLEVDIMFDKIDKSNLEEICEGYEFSSEKYETEILRGIELVEEHDGLDLYKKIPNQA